MKKSYLFVAISSLFLWACSTDDKAAAISKEAAAYMSANDVGRAEAKLKEGLIKLQGPSRLKAELIKLYVKSKQINKLEEYYAIADFSNVDVTVVSLGYSTLADYYASRELWANAASHFLRAGDVLSECEINLCRNWSAQNFLSAGLAYDAMHEPARVREQYDKIQSILGTDDCNGRRGTCPEVAKSALQLRGVLAGTVRGN